MDGGGGGGGGATQSTVTNTNIPEYARPYVETMLGATQQQLFNTKQGTTQIGTDAAGNPMYNTEITGIKPYQPYSTNMNDYLAGFSPMQQQAMQGIAGMQLPGQYGAATDVTGQGILQAANVGQQASGLMGMGRQAAGLGQEYARMATDPNAISAYMSPYMQNVVDVQQAEARRAANIAGQQQQSEAVGRGAFGGSRDALMRAERERNLATQLGAIQAQGSQNAFQNAQQAQQYGTNLGLQGLQAGAGMYGQGLGAQQAAIGQAMQGANQLAGLGGQALQAQQGIYGLQQQAGAQQQALEQSKINQAIQNYATAQQYPQQQLAFMNSMLRGLPLQTQTVQGYQAAPSLTSQMAGLGTAGIAGLGLYNTMNRPQ